MLERIFDPLGLNVAQQSATLLSRLPKNTATDLQTVLHHASKGHCDPKALLRTLSRLLALPPCTMLVAQDFRPLLVDLCARWLHDEEIDEVNCLEAFALLIETHEEIYPLLSHFLTRPSLSAGPLNFITLNPISTIPLEMLHRILLAYYRILHADADIPSRQGWSLRPLTLLMQPPHTDAGVRYLAVRCYGLQAAMSEFERDKLEAELLGEPGDADVPVRTGERVSDDTSGVGAVWIDGWLLPVLEWKRIAEYRSALTAPFPYYDGASTTKLLHDDHLSPLIANVSNIFLVRSTDAPPSPSPLFKTPTIVDALRSAALHLSRRLPILLNAPPGSGKSLLIQHLSSLLLNPFLKNHILTIYLSDTSLDPKSLLGSYVSSSTNPGNFEWIEGALVRAMKEGKWIVLKDIDKASGEVLGTLLPLIESLGMMKGIGQRARLDIPGRQSVEGAEGFALFATRSVQATSAPRRQSSFPSATFLGHRHWAEVQFLAPSVGEQQSILAARFPLLAGAPLNALLRVWDEILKTTSSSSSKASGGGTLRDVGMRDLQKWIQRVEGLLPSNPNSSFMSIDTVDHSPSLVDVFPNTSFREDIFLEACDVFFGFAPPSMSLYANLSLKSIGALLELSDDRVEWALRSRTPEYELEKAPSDGRTVAVRIGRTRLVADHASSILPLSVSSRPFALHRPSLLLLERIATCVHFSEPVLLVGETGTGKTTTIQHLSSLLHQKQESLVVINLSNQTESADLLGGYKPLDPRVPAAELQDTFVTLFDVAFSKRKNGEFVDVLRKTLLAARWKKAVAMWREASRRYKEMKAKDAQKKAETPLDDPDQPRKRRKTLDNTGDAQSDEAWKAFDARVNEFEAHHILAKSKFVFTFVEGPLVKAVRAGLWVLLDEINLASPETLEAITPLLQSPTSSITLTEQGTLAPIPRYPSFRIFASMNPATDVGKKDLPPNLRSRFTELWVPPPDEDREALLAIIKGYIGHCALSDRAAILDVAEFYTAIRKLVEERAIADGSNKRPHFSMRTLARALTFAADVTPSFGLRRALWEGCLMAFTMSLDEKSAALVTPLAERYILSGVKNISALLSQIPAFPVGGAQRDEFVQVGPFWLLRGPEPIQAAEEYILTPSVQTKLMDLSRIILTRRFPVLIEGPTSAGKTSAIEYLAKRTGHRFVRINNHEHTDIQEYLGAYVSDPDTGKLVFQDGLLVRALRRGDWIVLDELNLAPTDVLEALNRLLDDNRELIIPETQEIVRPHPHFMLFATQNPPGIYAGRKILSRAFRNRFLEVHFADVPPAELERIICERCKIAPSRGAKIVAVFHELQRRRQTGRVFETKQGFATLRDLFRWANRDWKDREEIGHQSLAEAGYMLLAERTRRADDKAVVKEVIESIMKVRIDEKAMYDHEASSHHFNSLPLSGLVWTFALQRLFTLVTNALRHHEPVLLVGETGSGKTSVCELFARATGQQLYAVNCHQNTETADLLGGQRPIRNRALLQSQAIDEARKVIETIGHSTDGTTLDDPESLAKLVDQIIAQNTSCSPELLGLLRDARRQLKRVSSLFEWHDGPLVQAMQAGDVLLLDEISLADDSVLERLNSVLEPSRTLVLAEKGGWDIDTVQITAAPSFQLVATMNPGGDYGKKELSPALRNRFTEIWVPPVELREDKLKIIQSLWAHEQLQASSVPLLDFCDWFASELGDPMTVGLRDILAWITFSNTTFKALGCIYPGLIFHEAAHLTLLDGLASLPQTSGFSQSALEDIEIRAKTQLDRLAPHSKPADTPAWPEDHSVYRLGLYEIPKGPLPPSEEGFNLYAPTTLDNATRVLRACQLEKSILIEGSPGVGKTSLVAALAKVTGHRLCRINLSDQTDLMDLFGSDLPVEGGRPGEFVWKPATFLKALQEGDWVLLDEMNLAPQAVLEGLNAVLDHRGTVYIPELGRSFVRHPEFRIFAAQNPLQQGGGRKGMPKSFLNRFTKVYVRTLTPNDLLLVCQHLFPTRHEDHLKRMIAFNTRLSEQTTANGPFGREGGPWEFNLRDVLRWMELMGASSGLEIHNDASEYLDLIYSHRFRSASDRQQVASTFATIFEAPVDSSQAPGYGVSSTYLQIGRHLRHRHHWTSRSRSATTPLGSHIPLLETLGSILQMGWLVILTGPGGSGKTSIARHMASLVGVELCELGMNTAMDTGDLLGSFEQADLEGLVSGLMAKLRHHVRLIMATATGAGIPWKAELLAAMRAPASLQALLDFANSVASNGFADDVEVDNLLQEVSRLRESGPFLTGRFEWVDGPLVTAMKKGQWLLLDHANLCSPSVLDRINSLCEPGGTLVLNERGMVNGEIQVLTPNPSFRLIMALDPNNGELSRAMRNRGVEISLTDRHAPADGLSILAAARLSCPDPGPVHSVFDAHVYFQTSRRGLDWSKSALQPELPNFGDIFHDSRSTLLAQHLRLYSQLNSSSHHTALLEFLARSTPLRSYRLLRRLLVFRFQQEDFKLPPPDTWVAYLTQAMVSTTTIACGVPPEFLNAQPIDLLLNPNLVLRRDDRTISPISTIPLELFELFYALESLKGAAAATSSQKPITTIERSKAVHFGRVVPGEIEKGLKEVYPLILAIEVVATEVQNRSYEVALDELPAILQVMNTLVAYARHLISTARQERYDYSSIRVIAGWFLKLEALNPLFGEIDKAARALWNAIKPLSGHGMYAIWATSLTKMPCPEDSRRIIALDNATSQFASTYALRLQALDFIATIALGQTPGEHEAKEIVQLTDKFLNQEDYAGPSEVAISDAVMLVVQELHALSWAFADENSFIDQSETLVELGLRTPGHRLSHLIPWRHARWSTGTFSDDPSSTNNLSFILSLGWFKSIWSMPANPPLVPSASNIAASLACPIVLRVLHEEYDWKGQSLDRLAHYQSTLERLMIPVKMQCQQRPTRRFLLVLVLLLEMLLILIRSYKPSYDPLLYESLVGIITEAQRDVVARGSMFWLRSLSDATIKTSDPYLRTSLSAHVIPALLSLSASKPNTISTFAMNIARAFIELYVPDTPVDPVQAQHCTSQYLQGEVLELTSRIHVNAQAERLRSGRDESPTLDILRHRLAATEKDLLANSSRGVSRSPDLNNLHALFGEISQFCATVIEWSKIENLLTSLQSSADSAYAQEATIQGSISSFLQRLDVAYDHYADVTRPFVMAVELLRYGIRSLSWDAHQDPKTTCVQSAITCLTAFPSVICSASFRRLDLNSLIRQTHETVKPAHWLLFGLGTVLEDVKTGISAAENADSIVVLYEQLFSLWQSDKDKEKKEEEEASSLYRPAKHTQEVLGDLADEEREFHELFPSYDEEDRGVPSPAGSFEHRNIDTADAQALPRVHLAIFGLQAAARSGCAWDLHVLLLNRLVSHASLTDEIDSSSAVHRILLIKDRLSKLTDTSRPRSSKIYDFYRDPNVPQAHRAVEVVQNMRLRLSALIAAWPDQMILIHLRDRCDTILAFDLHSPVAKLMSALEQLHLQTDDWEAYSNRDNNLKLQQGALASLIVDWRRLELSCWAQLLESEAIRFEEGSPELWFRLYEAVVQGASSAATEELSQEGATTTYIDSLLPLLDKFIIGSPLGQFLYRLQLLRSFVTLLNHHFTEAPQHLRRALDRVALLVQSTHDFYWQFQANASKQLSDQRGKLESDIVDFIKLASWKDVNVHALKASAQRTHHHLHKLIRKFREILRQPVQPLLKFTADDPHAAIRSIDKRTLPEQAQPALFTVPSSTSAAEGSAKYMKQLPVTFDRLKALIHTSVHPTLSLSISSAVDQLAVDIISTSQSLSTETIPQDQGEARTKAGKALMVRKRRAWADLLKELKVIGLPAHPTPHTLERQQIRARLMELRSPLIPSHLDTSAAGTLKKVEEYHYRISADLPELRDTLSNHNPDIATRDLTRGISFVESAFAFALQTRSNISQLMSHYDTLQNALVRLLPFGSSTPPKIRRSGLASASFLKNLLHKLQRLSGALSEAISEFRDHLHSDTHEASVLHQSADAMLKSLQAEVYDSSTKMQGVVTLVALTETPFLLEDELVVVSRAESVLSKCVSELSASIAADPTMYHYCHAIVDWLDPDSQDASVPDESTTIQQVATSEEPMINAILIITQSLVKLEAIMSDDDYVRRGSLRSQNTTDILNSSAIVSLVRDLFATMEAPLDHSGFDTVSHTLHQVSPFLEQYTIMLHRHISQMSQWCKSMYKLTYVLCSTVRTLAKDGFCKPPDLQDGKDEDEAHAGELADGTGLGEGAGNQNISQEIEDESQVEGLQGDQPEAQNKEGNEKEKDDDAIEMSADFEGELEDVSRSDDGQNEDDEDQDDEEHDEKVENLDPLDPSAVDEKLWSDDKPIEDTGKEDQANQSKAPQQTGDGEMAAKEDNKNPPNEPQDDQTGEGEQQEQDELDVEEEGPELGGPQPDLGAKLDQDVAESNNLDLPDDLNLGDTNEKSEMEVDTDLGESDGEELEDNQDGGQGGSDVEIEDVDDVNEEKRGDEDGQASPEEKGGEDMEGVELPDQNTREGEGDGADSQNYQTNANGSYQQGGPDNSGAPKDDDEDMDEKNDAEPRTGPPEDSLGVGDEDQTGDGGPSAAPMRGPDKKEPHSDTSSIPNPLRSLGDALKEIRRRFEEISQAEDGAEKVNNFDAKDDSQLEYTQNEDDGDTQALGPSGPEEATRLRDLKISENEPLSGTAVPLPDIEMADEPPAQLPSQSLPLAPTEQNQAGLDSAVTNADARHRNATVSHSAQDGETATAEGEDQHEQVDDAQVEAEMRQWLSTGQAEEGADAIWRLYESLTHDLSYSLCEQLRLILEPTRATRLRGDYRTGKRLNMKKIIPYIASEFTKDKIWLRRTRPSQREYQVLIALDDSKSMAESHSVHLAYETLALVSKALSRLEVGDVAIARFGQSVDILHSFDSGPFSDAAGAKVMGSFHFDQPATDVLSLLNTSLTFLARARERGSNSSATAGNLWQLQIIISDGICQSHDRLRSVLRRAEEQRVMIVFVIVDSLRRSSIEGGQTATSDPSQNSILSMNQVSYKNVDGRMELQMERYLDTFPFEYYVVLRDVEALPDVLSGTLKQFFERSSEE